MTPTRNVRARSLGGLVGIVVAVAGGFGAAVGFYSLPDPAALTVEAGAYARADQRAIAVSTQGDCNVQCTTLRIDAGRGGSHGHDAGFGVSDGFPRVTGGQDVNVFFSAQLQNCAQGGQSCNEIGHWQADFVPNDWFSFDPLMGGATFSGEVEGCTFDVTWTADPNGAIAPFAGLPESSAGYGAGHAEARVYNGYAEVSRVAPADIQMSPGQFDPSCDPTSIAGANGFLSQGLRRSIGKAIATFDQG